MPPKIRELIIRLEKAVFYNRGGKGSHRNYIHPKIQKPITISGKASDDVKHFQLKTLWAFLNCLALPW